MDLTLLEMVKGQKLFKEFTVQKNGAAFNLTSATLDFKASYIKGGTADITCSSPSSGIVITNAAGGIFELTISPSQTSSTTDFPDGFVLPLYYTLTATISGVSEPITIGDLLIYPRVQ